MMNLIPATKLLLQIVSHPKKQLVNVHSLLTSSAAGPQLYGAIMGDSNDRSTIWKQ